MNTVVALPFADSFEIPGIRGDELPFMLSQPGSTAEQGLLTRQLDGVPHDRLPLIHPDRVRPRFNLLKAYQAFRRFQQDKEQTSEVFHVFEAMPWTTVDNWTTRFLSTEEGRAIYASEPFLPDFLDDHAALRRDYPVGSLAHEYCDYMEGEGLSAAGLVHEYEVWRGGRRRLNDKVEWYNDRLRDTHDLLHILTGFGRDTLGEQCLLTFVFKQRPSIGHLTVGYLGTLVMLVQVKTKAPLWRAVRESRALGKLSGRIAEQSIRQLLALTPEEARARLNVKPARWYHECQRVWREEGIDPYKVLAKK